MDEVVKEHVNGNPLDFTGESTVHANMGSDPMKLAMNIWWSYVYNCEFWRLAPCQFEHPTAALQGVSSSRATSMLPITCWRLIP